ncbi:NUDIX hydrolase [Patescibacteria group bacterium]
MKKKRGPWVVVGTKTIYQNPWIKVREDKIIRPDGKKGIFGVVSMVPGVSVLPMDDKGDVYLTKEYHYGVERITIEAVSGGIGNKETKIQAAKRELKEETGLTAKKWTDLGVVDPFTTVVVSPNYMYLAQDLTHLKRNPEGTEKITVFKIPFKKAVEWVMENRITHSATTTLILKVNNYLNN